MLLLAYATGQSIEVVTIPQKDGVTDLAKLEELIDDRYSCCTRSISELLWSN